MKKEIEEKDVLLETLERKNNFDQELRDFEKRLNRIEIKFKVKPNLSAEWISKLRIRI